MDWKIIEDGIRERRSGPEDDRVVVLAIDGAGPEPSVVAEVARAGVHLEYRVRWLGWSATYAVLARRAAKAIEHGARIADDLNRERAARLVARIDEGERVDAGGSLGHVPTDEEVDDELIDDVLVRLDRGAPVRSGPCDCSRLGCYDACVPACGCPEVYEYCPETTRAIHFLGCGDAEDAPACSEAAS